MTESPHRAARAARAEAYATEWRALIRIALPVVAVQVGMMLMGVVDTLMMGHVSPNALASVALGNLYAFTLLVVAMGTLMALDPLVAQAVGARDHLAVTRAIQRGFVIAIGLGVVVMALMIPAAPVLRLFRQPIEVIPEAALYCHISVAGFIPFLVFVVLRQTLQAVGRMGPIVVTIVAGNVINGALNWVLIYGKLGAPALGVAGASIATAIGRWSMLLILAALAWKDVRPHLARVDAQTLSRAPLARMLALGLPIGLQQFLEVSAFAGVGLLMGTFGAVQVASHQIAINLAALTFMVPLGVSAAAAVRVGNAIGAGDAPRSRRAARLSYYLGTGFMCTTALLFLFFPEPLADLFTDEPRMIALAAALLPIAGVFQIFDGLQAVGAGVLRGMGDTRVPLVAMLSGYWLIGLPVSLVLGFRSGLGPQGLWWGFVAGLASVAIFLLWRVVHRFERGVSRVIIDAPH